MKALYKLYHDDNFVLICLSTIALVLGLVAIHGMPLFSDSAFHASVIRQIQRSGNFPSVSPVGWVTPDMNPLSFQPFLTHPPLFYIAGTILTLIGFTDISSLSLIAILPAIATAIIFFKLVNSFFGRNTAIISTLLLVFMPMSIWLTSHRIMEPLQYMVSVCLCYYAKKYIDTKNPKHLILAATFTSSILYIKITSLFIVVAVLIWLLIKKVSLKHIFLFVSIATILYMPYMYFSIKTRGTVSYSEPGLPIIDSHIFNPWWNWPRDKDEQRLDSEANGKNLVDRLALTDYQQRDYIQKDIANKDLLSGMQAYSTYPISPNANKHWFSPFNEFYGMFFILFLIGISTYFKKFRNSGYHFLIIPLFVVVTLYLTKTAELRYFFIINILLIPFYALAISEAIKKVSKPIKSFILVVLLYSLVLISISEIGNSHLYANSLRHNYLPAGQGIAELRKISPNDLPRKTKTIFTPATSDVAYYLDRKTVWDYRLFFINKGEVQKYLDLYNVSELLIPKFFVTNSITDVSSGQKVPNTKANWEGYSIPLDSSFISYLNDTRHVYVVRDFKSFTLYERLDGKD